MLAEYHLNVLEKLGLVTSHVEGGYRRFFPTRGQALQLDATDKRWLGLLRRSPILGIVLLLLEKERLSAIAIAEDLSVPLSTALYQLRQMEQGALARTEREGNRATVVLADRDRVLELLRSYHPTPDALSRYAELWSTTLQSLGHPPPPPPLEEPAQEQGSPLPPEVAHASASVQTVYRALLTEALTGQELVFETRLARRTVYAALSHLKALGLLRQQGHLADMRQTKFWVEGTPPNAPPVP